MNQILITKDIYKSIVSKSDITNEINIKNKKKHVFFKYQLLLSVFLLFIFSLYFVNNYNSIKKEENISKKILSNYNITKLYSRN